jgi:hypothetical protein
MSGALRLILLMTWTGKTLPSNLRFTGVRRSVGNSRHGQIFVGFDVIFSTRMLIVILSKVHFWIPF